MPPWTGSDLAEKTAGTGISDAASQDRSRKDEGYAYRIYRQREAQESDRCLMEGERFGRRIGVHRIRVQHRNPSIIISTPKDLAERHVHTAKVSIRKGPPPHTHAWPTRAAVRSLPRPAPRIFQPPTQARRTSRSDQPSGSPQRSAGPSTRLHAPDRDAARLLAQTRAGRPVPPRLPRGDHERLSRRRCTRSARPRR